MRIDDVVVEALRPLWRHKLRSFLSVLSIVIGVAAVIALTTLMQSASNGVNRRVEALGANLVVVTVNPLLSSTGGAPTLSLREALALGRIHGIHGVAPATYATMLATRGKKAARITVYATGPTFAHVMQYHLAEGRDLTAAEEHHDTPVAVLGAATAHALFSRKTSPVGHVVDIGGQPYRVTGVLAPKGSLFGVNEDAIALIPLTTYQQVTQNGAVTSVYLHAVNPSHLGPVVAAVTRRLTAWLGPQNQYTIVTQSAVLTVADRVSTLLARILVSVAAISIVVGGLGILNVHVMAVSERVREIGVRKSLGARRQDILAQFLAESMLVAGIGGAIGIGIGVLLSQEAARLLRVSLEVEPHILIGALVGSLFLGLTVGLYPAFRAASLSPVDALKHE
jgi:putative ABC transport system permease protein